MNYKTKQLIQSIFLAKNNRLKLELPIRQCRRMGGSLCRTDDADGWELTAVPTE